MAIDVKTICALLIGICGTPSPDTVHASRWLVRIEHREALPNPSPSKAVARGSYRINNPSTHRTEPQSETRARPFLYCYHDMLIPLELPEEILLLIMELALDFVWDLPDPVTETGLQTSSELLALSLTCKDLRRLSFHVPMRGSFICTIPQVQRRCVIIIGEPFIRTPAHVRQLAALDKWATTEQATNMRSGNIVSLGQDFLMISQEISSPLYDRK